MEHDFFYGSQSESFSFCRIPRQLLTGAAYREISTDAKRLHILGAGKLRRLFRAERHRVL